MRTTERRTRLGGCQRAGPHGRWADGEDRLLAFEHLVAAAALVIIEFFQAWQNPQGSKNEMGWLFALFVMLVFVLLGFANGVKNRVFARSEAY
jgi:hypothetical protein